MNYRQTLIRPIRHALTDEWQTTQEIARAVGHSWDAGATGNWCHGELHAEQAAA